MSTEPTPGPWLVHDAQDFNQGLSVRSKDGRVAFVALPCDQSSKRVVYYERDEANARLIAAAPDLLEALQLAREYIIGNLEDMRAAFRGYEEVGEIPSIEHDLAAVDAALARALAVKANAALSGCPQGDSQ